MSDSAIFKAAVKLAPEQRVAYLNQTCGENSGLRREVESLLQAHDASASFLHDLPARPLATIEGAPIMEGPGSVIGPYKLLQQIGEGGMGVVYMAEQQEPVRRKVALKIIKPGMDSKQVIARFEAERQALAMMDHQNIAKVLDAGTVASGQWPVARAEPLATDHCQLTTASRPYFVMELVHGISLTKYCDDHKLTLQQRLALFVPICQAVQHAHQKGIIHRDLKPSNVLVTMYDDKPVPKVIDFGVAKAVEQRLTEKTLFTQYGTMVGTFEYMSPEQAEMNAFGVDTRSDIYSLGVLLYELLTGTTPLERQRLREVAFGEIVRLIKEEEPPKPSTRLSSSGAALAAISQQRGTEPARLVELVRGELDWIMMRCLEKDRTRRYETANALARDVERYLHDEPVEACPPTASYRLRKFARKHRRLLATVAAFVALLLLGATASTWQAVRATQAEGEALENEKLANASAVKAQEKETEAKKERDDAQRQRDEVQALNEKLRAAQAQLRSTLYAANMNLAQTAWDDANVPRVLGLLDQNRPRQGDPDLRRFEWHYLHRLCNPDHLLPLQVPFFSGNAKFSPDGKRLFAVRGAGTQGSKGVSKKVEPELMAVDARTGEELFRHTLTGGGRVVILSSDAKLVASARKVWDTQTGKELFTRASGGATVFSPDGQLLAGSSGKDVMLWDTQTGKELPALKGHSEGVINLAFSHDGKRLVSVSGKWDFEKSKYGSSEVKVWDVQAGKELLPLKGPDGTWKVSFSPDGKRLLTESTDAKVWDAQTGKELYSVNGQGGLTFVGFSPDGRRLVSAEAASKAPRINLWDAQSGQMLLTLHGHVTPIHHVVFSPDGKWLASRESGRVVAIWDLQTGQEIARLRGVGSPAVGSGLAFSPNGKRLAVSGWDFSGGVGKGGPGHANVKVWDWQSQKKQEKLTLQGISVPGPHWLGATYVAFSADLKRVAGVSLTTVKVWDTQTGQEIATLKGLSDFVLCLAFSPDGGRIVAGSGPESGMRGGKSVPGVVKVWDVKTGQELLSLTGHTNSVGRVAFSPDGKLLASAGVDSTVKVWDAQTGKEHLTFAAKERPGNTMNLSLAGVAFSPDGKRLAANGKLWDVQTGKEILALKGLFTRPVAFSPDGKRLVSVAGPLAIWDAHTGEHLLPLASAGAARFSVSSAAFSPDGKRLAIAADDHLKLLDVQSGQEVLSLKVDRDIAGAIAFSPDGATLGRVSTFGTVTMWDATPLRDKPMK